MSWLCKKRGTKKFNNNLYFVTFFLIRSLAGKYVLKAKNKHGEDSAEVQIDVFGKPTAPTGPLNVRLFNIFKKERLALLKSMKHNCFA